MTSVGLRCSLLARPPRGGLSRLATDFLIRVPQQDVTRGCTTRIEWSIGLQSKLKKVTMLKSPSSIGSPLLSPMGTAGAEQVISIRK